MDRNLTTSLYFCLLLAFISSPVRADAIAKVILSVGENKAFDPSNQQRSLKRKDSVFPGDRLVTAERSRLQLRFNDNSRMSMMPETEFVVDQHQTANDDSAKAVYRLLRGGMRTLTGQIAQKSPQNYQVDAVVATIGVRGTVYELYLCDALCKQKKGLDEGLYCRVLEGEITATSDAEEASIMAGKQYFIGMDQQTRWLKKWPSALAEVSEGFAGDSSLLDNPLPPVLDPNQQPGVDINDLSPRSPGNNRYGPKP